MITRPKPEQRTERFIIRLTKSEKKALTEAAWLNHMDMSTYARNVVMAAVKITQRQSSGRG